MFSGYPDSSTDIYNIVFTNSKQANQQKGDYLQKHLSFLVRLHHHPECQLMLKMNQKDASSVMKQKKTFLRNHISKKVQNDTEVKVNFC